MTIVTVYAWTNGMVAVFDDHGQQVPDLQGRLSERKAMILESAGEDVLFHYARWGGEVMRLSRDEFLRLHVDPVGSGTGVV